MSLVQLPSQRSVVLHGPRDLRVEHRLLWPPANNQAQVRITQTGLCGSDLHYYLHGRNGDFAIQEPLVLGHEAAGIVTALGSQVSGLRIGQRVAIECGIMCSNCDYCHKGRYNLCKGMRFCSSAKTFPHLDGTLQEFINHPAHLLHPLPDNVSFDQAALAEPLSVLIHASRRSGLSTSSNQSVLVFGVGSIGLLACSLARAQNASKIVALDINPHRLEFARKNGFADAVYCLARPTENQAKNQNQVKNQGTGCLAQEMSSSSHVSSSASSSSSSSSSSPSASSSSSPSPSSSKLASEESLKRAKDTISIALQEFDQPDGFDIVFECTGAEPCIQMSIHAAISGGKVMLVGMGTQSTTLPISSAALREVDILGCFRYANTYPTALSLLSSGKLRNVDRLVTHRVRLEEARNAFELVKQGVDREGRSVIKVMVGDV